MCSAMSPNKMVSLRFFTFYRDFFCVIGTVNLLFKPDYRFSGGSDKIWKFPNLTTFSVSLSSGHFYWLVQPERLSFDEAVQACLDDGAEIAKVGHMYAAWRLEGYDRCDAGWLADGSVRYPIANPRKNCSPTEAAVRFVGFPDKKKKSYGVYCFRPEQWGQQKVMEKIITKELQQQPIKINNKADTLWILTSMKSMFF